MARSLQKLAFTPAILVLCVGTNSVQSRAQTPSPYGAPPAVGNSHEPGGGLMHRAPGLAVGGEFESAPTLFRQGKFAEAERQFAWIAAVRTGTSWGERSQFYLAECQYQQKKYVEALQSFERLHTDYPGTDYLDKLVRREYEIAQLWATWGKPTVRTARKIRQILDQALPGADTKSLAFRALSAVWHNDPTGPLADHAAIKIADYYMTNGEYNAAAACYDQFLAGYPGSPFCPHARLASVEARFRSYLLEHHDSAFLKLSRDVAKTYLRAF
jgi:outer membrane protein assembly factor BamD (BamD/ComL family)